MRRGRIFILLLLVLILGVVVVFVFMQTFMNGDQQEPGEEALATPTPVIDMLDVVIITQHVDRGQILNPNVLDTVPYRRDAFFEGMFTNADAVVGMRARIDLEPGFILTNNMLTTAGEGVGAIGSDWALEIPRGMVAVSIPISRLSSVAFAPRPGDHVNIMGVFLFTELDTEFQTNLPNMSAQVLGPIVSEDITILSAQVADASTPEGRGELDLAFEESFYVIPSERQRPRLVSQTLIQDVIVLYMGTFPLVDEDAPSALPEVTDGTAAPTPIPEFEDEDTTEPVEPPPPPDVITLIVSPQDAVALNYLLYSGAELTLALRSAEDDSRIQSEAVTLQYLLDNYNIPIPVKLPYGMEPRIDMLVPPALINDLIPTPVP